MQAGQHEVAGRDRHLGHDLRGRGAGRSFTGVFAMYWKRRAFEFAPRPSARRSAVQWTTWTPAPRAASARRAMFPSTGAAASARAGSCERSPTIPRWISCVTSAVCAGATSAAKSRPCQNHLRVAQRRFLVAEPEGIAQHGLRVLAEPRKAGERALGHARELHGFPDEHVAAAVGPRHLEQHVARRDVRVRGEVRGRVVRPRDDALGAASHASSRVLPAPASTAGRTTSSVCAAQPRASRSAGRRPTRGGRRGGRAARSGARGRPPSRTSRRRESPRTRRSCRTPPTTPAPHRPEERRHVRDREGRVEHGDVEVLPEAGTLALAQRGEDPDHGEERARDVSERARDDDGGGWPSLRFGS